MRETEIEEVECGQLGYTQTSLVLRAGGVSPLLRLPTKSVLRTARDGACGLRQPQAGGAGRAKLRLGGQVAQGPRRRAGTYVRPSHPPPPRNRPQPRVGSRRRDAVVAARHTRTATRTTGCGCRGACPRRDDEETHAASGALRHRVGGWATHTGGGVVRAHQCAPRLLHHQLLLWPYQVRALPTPARSLLVPAMHAVRRNPAEPVACC